MKLIIEPEDGVAPLLSAIQKAKTSIDIAIFRFDRADIEKALEAAIERGVKVHALVAFTNAGGQKRLRKLEMRCLQAGMTVSRTADDLIRYHGKYMVIDKRVLLVLSFNYTHLDIDHSRGFGIITTNSVWVEEALKLFEADSTRGTCTAGSPTFVISPVNARKALASFLKRAHRQLLIYDPEISDDEMIRLLNERSKAGVEIRVIGEVDSRARFPTAELGKMRLHTRTIIRDSRQAFIGSQSLRAAELDSRREVGLIVRLPEIVSKLAETFESDWKSADQESKKEFQAPKREEVEVDAEKVERVLFEELHPISRTVQKAVSKVVRKAGDQVLEEEMVKDTVKKVVKEAVKQAVKNAAADGAES
jgi:cardiolipin synthase A/B